jgi:DNA-directed RNA polymerase subunit RPC12/RpoP
MVIINTFLRSIFITINSYLLLKVFRMVVTRIAYQCCGQHISTSDKSPALPRDVGVINTVTKCPSHGLLPQGSAATGSGAVYVCQKCGLLQNVTGRLQKHNGIKLRCHECNAPLVADAIATSHRCIKCGRCYDPAYAVRAGNADPSGSQMLKCKHCGPIPAGLW